MYNVLIVDDEPTIREGLTSIISWEDYGFQVIGTAKNGKDALEKYRQLPSVDLIIADIRMPEMSGLELIETIRKTNSTIHFIILSGYADFEYAKKAMISNVEGYMLKPVDEDELITYIERLNVKIGRELELNQLKLVEEKNNLQKLIDSILSTNELISLDELNRHQLNWNSYQLLLIKLLTRIHSEDYSVTNHIKDKLVNVFEGRNRGVVFTKDSFTGVLLKEFSQTQHNLTQLYHDLAQELTDARYDVFMALGPYVEKVEEIHMSYEEAFTLLENRFFYHKNNMVTNKSVHIIKELETQLSVSHTSNFENVSEKLFYALEIGNKKGIKQILNEMAVSAFHNHGSEHEIKTYLVQNLTTVLTRFTHANPDSHIRISDYSSLILDLYNQHTLAELLNQSQSLLNHIIDQLDMGNTDIQLKKMIDLIERNYHENLKLETLADAFNYNSAYLGKLFKNYTGDYFNTYLDKVRIKHSKKLLLKGLKVYQVAERIGYTNVDYFHSKFKKYEGISPSAYRKEQELKKG